MKTVAIVQSCYIPWKGYFDLMRGVDEFVLYDDVQYTRRDWRNRNLIKTPSGPRWLTIPVEVKGRFSQRICDTRVSDPSWPESHWKTLCHTYARAPYFQDFRSSLEEMYRSAPSSLLSEINRHFLLGVSSLLGFTPHLRWSTDFILPEERTERLVSLCVALNATCYLSGPSAKSYLDEGLFTARGISVRYADYSNYPEYPQLYGDFTHTVSILDLLFMMGPSAPSKMKNLTAL